MPHPGFFAVLLGFGFATLLVYYIFAKSEQEEQQNTRGSSNRIPTNDTYLSDNRWRHTDNNFRGRRRPSIDTGNPDDCTICLSAAAEKLRIQLDPCNHIFHIKCIKMWKSQGPQSSRHLCPNCRCSYTNEVLN